MKCRATTYHASDWRPYPLDVTPYSTKDGRVQVVADADHIALDIRLDEDAGKVRQLRIRLDNAAAMELEAILADLNDAHRWAMESA